MTTAPNITYRRMVMLGMGWFGFQFFWAFYSGSMSLFLKDFTESKFAISLVLSLAGLSGCLVPPISGYLSDRTVTRFGRRRPYIFAGIFGMFFCMMSLPHLPTLCIIAVISAFTYFSIDFAMAPYWSLLPDTTPVDQRATASGVMNLLGGIGVIAYFLVGSRIWDANSTIVFYIVAVVSLGSVLTTVAVVREPELQPLAPTVRTFNPFAYLQSVMRETNVMRFLGAQSLWWLGFWTIQPFLTLFVVERLGATEGTSLFVPMAAGVVSTIVVVPLGMLGDRHSRKRILSCAVAFWVAAEISIGFSQNIMHAVLSVGSIGFPIAAVMAIGYAHMLDLVPAKRTAEFVGLHILSMAAPQIFGPMIGGKLIDTYGYRSMFPTAALFTISALIVLQFVHPRRHIGEESSRAENSFTPA